MSLAKIPFLLSTAIALHVTVVPPNPPPPLQARFSTNVSEKFLLAIPLIVKIHSWALASIEMAVILANAFPPLPFSHLILSTFAHGPIAHLSVTNGFLLASLSAIIGGLIRFLCYRTLGRFFTFELSVHKEHALITSGPYTWVRHPSYTGGILAGIGGIHCFVTNQTSWLQACSGMFGDGCTVGRGLACMWILGTALGFVALRSRINQEDEMLKKEFGLQWEEWAKKVPSRVIPGIY